MRVNHKGDYQTRRRQAYPPIGDQLDAIWKALSAQRVTLPTEARAMLERVEAVKARFPKGR